MSHILLAAPLFPLNLVPFEGETLNLHIFEERYQELVADCLAGDFGFGIVPYINNRLCEVGGYMRIQQVVERYPDGRLDIRCLSEARFQLLEFENPLDGHLYAGGKIEVMEPALVRPALPTTQQALLSLVQRLYALLQCKLDTKKLDTMHLSYALGHKIGLSLDQEYELFLLTEEEERQQYLIDHLARTLPSLEEFNRTRAMVQLNGHFQKFDPLTF
jgi:Lon protease-like protein